MRQRKSWSYTSGGPFRTLPFPRGNNLLDDHPEGHERLHRARDRFAQAAKEQVDQEPQRKRNNPEGEGEQSGSSSGSGPVLPPAPPPLEPPPVAKRGLEQETEMTAATVEQQGESKRRREHPEAPQAADSSSSGSSSSESSTDTEMGLVDVCTILCDSTGVS